MDATDKILLESKICRKRFSDLTVDNVNQKIIISNYAKKEYSGYFIINSVYVLMYQCHWCRKMQPEMKCCAGCYNFSFCSKECQKLAWKAPEYKEWYHNKKACSFWQQRNKVNLKFECLEVINSKEEKEYFKLEGGYHHWMIVSEVIDWLKKVKDENIKDNIPFDVLIGYLPKFSYGIKTTAESLYDIDIYSYAQHEKFLY
jgi:hypothetical protein